MNSRMHRVYAPSSGLFGGARAGWWVLGMCQGLAGTEGSVSVPPLTSTCGSTLSLSHQTVEWKCLEASRALLGLLASPC